MSENTRETLIKEKIRAGLTAAQAEEVVAAQEAHDAALEAAAKKAAKPAK